MSNYAKTFNTNVIYKCKEPWKYITSKKSFCFFMLTRRYKDCSDWYMMDVNEYLNCFPWFLKDISSPEGELIPLSSCDINDFEEYVDLSKVKSIQEDEAPLYNKEDVLVVPIIDKDRKQPLHKCFFVSADCKPMSEEMRMIKELQTQVADISERISRLEKTLHLITGQTSSIR